MFRNAISAIVLTGIGTLALTAHAEGNRSRASLAMPVAVAATEAPAGPWGSPPLNPVASLRTALVDVGPVAAAETFSYAGKPAAPAMVTGTQTQPPTYTSHPAAFATTRIVPVRLGEGFSPEQRSQIVQALREWNQVLNGFGRLQIVDDTAPATGAWHLRAVRGAAPSTPTGQPLQTLAYTQPGRTGGGTVLVYTVQAGAFDLVRVMRHEFGHVLGLGHEARGGVMAAHYSNRDQRCIDRHAAAALAAAWRLPVRSLNWCEL